METQRMQAEVQLLKYSKEGRVGKCFRANPKLNLLGAFPSTIFDGTVMWVEEIPLLQFEVDRHERNLKLTMTELANTFADSRYAVPSMFATKQEIKYTEQIT